MRLIPLLAAALLFAGCSGNPVELAGPSEQVSVHNGLEQQITITPSDPALGDPDWFHLKSTLVNRSDAPITVRVVTCWLDPKVHLRTNASFNGYAIPGCIPEPSVVTLAPGESSRTLWFSGRIERRGRYKIEVRHALDPEFWGAVYVTAR
jgi:uncharacterized protein YcfL